MWAAEGKQLPLGEGFSFLEEKKIPKHLLTPVLKKHPPPPVTTTKVNFSFNFDFQAVWKQVLVSEWIWRRLFLNKDPPPPEPFLQPQPPDWPGSEDRSPEGGRAPDCHALENCSPRQAGKGKSLIRDPQLPTALKPAPLEAVKATMRRPVWSEVTREGRFGATTLGRPSLVGQIRG